MGKRSQRPHATCRTRARPNSALPGIRCCAAFQWRPHVPYGTLAAKATRVVRGSTTEMSRVRHSASATAEPARRLRACGAPTPRHRHVTLEPSNASQVN
jgi:hypothetical protein